MTTHKTNDSPLQALATCFTDVAREFADSPAMRFVASSDFSLRHYKEYLRQVFHYTRENPQLLAVAASFLRGRDRTMVDAYLRHALEEAGHDQWALRDLAALGQCVDAVPLENPLPETLALNAFAYYQLVHRNPVGHLGYLYFLEFLPTSAGPAYMATLERIGVPRAATRFLRGHVTIDVHHNQLMERYVAELVRDESDLAAVEYAMRATGRLYASLMGAVIEAADRGVQRGICWPERDRAGEPPIARCARRSGPPR